MSEQPTPTEPSPDEPLAPSTPTVTLLPRERAAAGLGLGRGLAIIVVIATVLPALMLVREALRERSSAPVDVVEAPVGGVSVDATAVRAALDAATVQAEAARAAYVALHVRAVDAERGDRLRAVARVIARARDARRAAGQTGADLRGPFPASELGDLSALGLGETRWLIARDGALVAPAGVVVPAGLATTGRDEDPLRLDVDGKTLVRRCVPNEGFCVVDVDVDVAVVAPIVDLTPIGAALAGAAPAPVATTTTTTTTTSTPSTPSKAPLLLMALLAIAAGAFVASRLVTVSTHLRRQGWRLRGGRAADVDGSGIAEIRDLDAAIDDVLKSLGDTASLAALQRHRRERVSLAAAALDDARDRGGVPRLVAHDDDDAALASLIFSVNALLDVLDARATRFKLAVDDVSGAMKVLTPLAQRLMRLARLPELPTQAVDELNSLGTAVGQRARRGGALPAIVDEASRLAPASTDVLGRADALKPLPDADALRLGVAAQQGAENSTAERSNSID